MKKNLNQVRDTEAHQSEKALNSLAAKALDQHGFIWKGPVLHRIKNHVKPVSLIHEVAADLLVNSAPLFELEETKRGQVKLRPSELGERLVTAFSADFQQIEDEWVLHDKSPVYLLFYRLRRLLQMDLRSYLHCLHTRDQAEAILVFLNRMVDALCRRLARKAFKKRHANFRRNAIENFLGLSQSIDWLAQRHDVVVTLRFDLYRRAPGSQPVEFGDEPDVSLGHQLVELRESFHRSMDYRFGEDLLGYAWTFEYGRETGFHIHYLVFLRPEGNEDHAGLVDQLEIKWLALTDGHGFVHNCNRQAHKYNARAIGLVRLDDPQVTAGLRYIVVYFTLAGLYVTLKEPKVAKKFGKGRFPEGPLGSAKSGRPPKAKRGQWAQRALAMAQTHYLNFM